MSGVDAQVSDERERLSLAHVVLDASGDLDSTKQAAHQLYEDLVSLWPDRLSELSRHFPERVLGSQYGSHTLVSTLRGCLGVHAEWRPTQSTGPTGRQNPGRGVRCGLPGGYRYR